MISPQAFIIRSLISALVQEQGKGDELYSVPRCIHKPEKAYIPPENFTLSVIQTENATAELVRGKRNKGLIFNIHGGGFMEGLTNARRRMAEHYAEAAEGVSVLSPDYRTAPEVTHPAALMDVFDAWKLIEGLGFKASDTVITSDSAGGNLAFALLLYLRDRGEALPVAVFSMSPLLDFSMSGASHGFNLYRDPLFGKPRNWLPKEPVEKKTLRYMGKSDPFEPYLSPLYGDLHGLPPMLLQTGTWEILLSDTVDFADKARRSGVDARASLYDGMPHYFQSMYNYLPESRRAWREIKEFLNEHLPSKTNM